MYNNPAPNKPIFIVGAPRSGTSLFYRVLSHHPALAYFATLPLARYYYEIGKKISFLRGYSRLERFFLLRPTLTRNISNLLGMAPWIVEGFSVWGGIVHDVDHPVLGADQATENKIAFLHRLFVRYCEVYDKQRFLSKDPANSLRLAFLDQVFPDGFFIHIIRDPRAVVNSLENFPLSGNPMRGWWLRSASDAQQKQIEKFPVLSWALRWQCTIEEIWRHRTDLGDRYVEFPYEELMRRPVPTLKRILNKVKLPWLPTFETTIAEINFENRNFKWRTDLTLNQQQALTTFLKRHLELLGYE